jgi:hypothetical protein
MSADAAKVAGQTITVPMSDWLQLHRDIGFAEGLLQGWLMAGDGTEQALKATERFLGRNPGHE